MHVATLLVIAFASLSSSPRSDGAHDLVDAARSGDVAKVRALIDAGADTNARNEAGESALTLAAGSGHRAVAAVLLESGADVNLTNTSGTAALAATAKGGHTETVRDLLKAGADVRAQNKMGVTALMVAARHGNPETIEALLDGGADVNAETAYGGNALRIATMEDHVPATLLLLRAEADTANVEGQKTTLTSAIREQRDEAVMLLLANGHKVTAYALVVASREGSLEMFEILANPETQTPETLRERAVRVEGDVKPPHKIKDVAPHYPGEARDKRIQGIVILEALIDIEGNVTHIRILRSIPALDQAAIDAVRQWKYEPTLMHGVPIPIVMTVTVNFALS